MLNRYMRTALAVLTMAIFLPSAPALAMPKVDAAYVTANPRNKIFSDADKQQAADDVLHSLSYDQQRTLLLPTAQAILDAAIAPVTQPTPSPTPTPTDNSGQPSTTPAPADAKAADAKWILEHQDRYTAEQVAWANWYLGTPASTPSTPDTTTPSTPDPAPSTPPITNGVAIASQAALDKALADKSGGKILLLASGGYSVVLANTAYSAPVIITSADRSKPANVGWHKLTNVANLTFFGLDMSRAPAAANPESENIGKAAGVTWLTYDSVHFYGTLDGNPGNDMMGPLINGTNVTIRNSVFEQLFKGFAMSGTNLTVSANDFHDVRSDGMNFANAHNVLIERNRGSNFARASYDHPDFIQFLTNGQAASDRITIRFNVMEQGAGNGTQGIFLRDETGSMPYADVTIASNAVLGSNMQNCITVSHGDRVTIKGNSCISPLDDAYTLWIRLGGDGPMTNVAVNDNIADAYFGLSANDNYIAKDVLSAAQKAMLTTGNFPNVRAAQMVVAGKGWQP